MSAGHPCDPLTADEIATVVAAVKADARWVDGSWFSTVTVDEPLVGDRSAVPRRARVVVVDGPDAHEVVRFVEEGIDLVGLHLGHQRPPGRFRGADGWGGL